ncbi:hypothetical protein PR202_ga12563 [Eleusine coracana subsp. coracana]|uniref:Secretory carrier-associated membrane protein n=1 Tax=Eleusine coracana subsp. coracana TaxID=191504 RepID=A0AAV5CCG0_ELECO|nr:hypothetical protein PR202_ga12563 [Eleusine coracana subsp. coracana]
MAGRWRQDDNPFAEGEGDVNPFSHARPTPLPPEPAGFYNDIDASVDIPLGTKKDKIQDLTKKEKELLAKEDELNRREEEIKRREEALARAGILIEPKNWPPFFPIIHVDISNDIPVHLQRVQYVAFASLLVSYCLLHICCGSSIILLVRKITDVSFLLAYYASIKHASHWIMYFVGFALFVLEALLSIWVMQKVYWFFRGKGNQAVMRSDAAGAHRSDR